MDADTLPTRNNPDDEIKEIKIERDERESIYGSDNTDVPAVAAAGGRKHPIRLKPDVSSVLLSDRLVGRLR